MTKTALVLAGHGSHISPQTAGLVWEHVDELRALNVADEVTAAFWKEMPSLHTVFNSLEATDITVVPLFTAQGYFTQTVIPAEMGLSGPITHRDGRTVRYTRTLSEHPYLGQVVRERIEDALQRLHSAPEQTAIAIVGHSTKRNPESRRATEQQADAIREAGLAREVVAIYLDDDPQIQTIYDLTRAPNLVVVPYFLAMGSHTAIDVPRELGLHPYQPYFGEIQDNVNGRVVYYTQPVGVAGDLPTAILELAREAGMPAGVQSSDKGGVPQAGASGFMGALQMAGKLSFGQLQISSEKDAQGNPYYCIAVPGEGEYEYDFMDFQALRRFIRENPFRSLATSNDLGTGWYVKVTSLKAVHQVVETIYPSAVADWAAQRRGEFQPNTFTATSARQTGDYRPLVCMDRAEQNAIVGQVCGRCVRHPTWFRGTTPENAIPCPEPCNHWLSAALKAQK